MNTTPPIALGIIDMQRGFMPATEEQRLGVAGFGELPIEGAELLVPKVNALLGAYALKGITFITQDWHPLETAHFGDPPNFTTTWPIHCVENTQGAALHPEIVVPETTEWFRKGNEVLLRGEDDTSYSGFNGVNITGETLEEWLNANAVQTVVIGGIALDHCAKATALDLKRKTGLDVTFITDATEAVTPETGAAALEEMTAAGIRFATTEQVLRYANVVLSRRT